MITGEKILVTGVHGAVAFPLARALAADNEVWGAARFTDPATRAKVDGAGITAVRFLTGSYVTSLDMAGVSVTVSVLDQQTKALWDAPVHTAALRWGA